jgi:hypothetical protein
MLPEDAEEKDKLQETKKSTVAEHPTSESDKKTEPVKENQLTDEDISKLVTLYLENH